MNDNQKLFADIQRIIKHDRADNNGNYSGTRCSESIANHFVSCYKDLKSLAESIADYWQKEKILTSSNIDSEPTEENINWILEAAEFLDGTMEKSNAFSKQDWLEIKDIVNAEAGDLPIDLLSAYMANIMENGAL